MEALVSIILLAIVLIGGANLYFVLCHLQSKAVHKKTALEMAASTMEELKTRDFAFVNSEGPQNLKVGNLNAQQTITVEPIDGYKKVELDLVWTEVAQQGPSNIKLTTLMAP